MRSVDVHHWDVHEAARGACVTEQQAVHEGTWRCQLMQLSQGCHVSISRYFSDMHL